MRAASTIFSHCANFLACLVHNHILLTPTYGLADVDDIDAIRSRLPQVWLHVHLEVLCAQVALCGEEFLDIFGRLRAKVISDGQTIESLPAHTALNAGGRLFGAMLRVDVPCDFFRDA